MEIASAMQQVHWHRFNWWSSKPIHIFSRVNPTISLIHKFFSMVHNFSKATHNLLFLVYSFFSRFIPVDSLFSLVHRFLGPVHSFLISSFRLSAFSVWFAGFSGQSTIFLSVHPSSQPSQSGPHVSGGFTSFQLVHNFFRLVNSISKLVHNIFCPVHTFFNMVHSFLRPIDKFSNPIHRHLLLRPIATLLQLMQMVVCLLLMRVLHISSTTIGMKIDSGECCGNLYYLKLEPHASTFHVSLLVWTLASTTWTPFS